MEYILGFLAVIGVFVIVLLVSSLRKALKRNRRDWD